MGWIIRNAAGEICGRFANRPGAGNKMPDGTPEASEYLEENPQQPGYDQARVEEADAFVSAAEARFVEGVKRAAALKALEEQRLTEAMQSPDAPQAVKDYAAAKSR